MAHKKTVKMIHMICYFEGHQLWNTKKKFIIHSLNSTLLFWFIKQWPLIDAPLRVFRYTICSWTVLQIGATDAKLQHYDWFGHTVR